MIDVPACLQVGPPEAAHPVFQRLRFGLLSSETLLHLIRLTLIKAVQVRPPTHPQRRFAALFSHRD